MSFKGKVKALLEGGEGTRDHPGGRGKTRVVGQEERGEDLQSLIHSLIAKEVGTGRRSGAERHNGHAAKPKKSQTKPKKEKSSDESQTENSNHPFYQKVKALSRGKKNNSLLERKSPKLLFILASLKPCEKKSKTDGVKSKMDEEEEKSQDPVEVAKRKALAAIDAAEKRMKKMTKKNDKFKQARTRELAQQHPDLPEPREYDEEPEEPPPIKLPPITGNWFQRRTARGKRRAAARRAREDQARRVDRDRA